MIDPLSNFDWTSLHAEYDRKCLVSSRFKPEAPALRCFSAPPQSDRSLYYALMEMVASERADGTLMTLECYAAAVYWKMYSTSPKVNNDIARESDIRDILESKLRTFARFPSWLPKNVHEVLNMVNQVLELNLYGTGLPVCTTVLHYLYPDTVPIFDQMVLRAVGFDREDVKKRRLNQSTTLYQQYLGHHWDMVDKYAEEVEHLRESPVRAVEMALWVSRGNE